MFKRILVPVDPSKPFAAANDYACRLAKRFGASVIANYIVDESLQHGAGEAVGSLDMAMEFVGRDAMDDFVRLHPDLTCEKRLSYGPTATVIFQSVLGTGADLVVVGGYGPIHQARIWGSTVLDIIHHAERSTFVVRKNSPLPEEGEVIIVPYDGSDRAVEALNKIAAFAAELGAQIDLVHAATKREAERALHVLEKGRIQAEGMGVNVDIHCLERPWWRPKGWAILEHAKAVKSPLIAMSRLGRSSMQTGRSRTLAWIVTHAGMPVWVVRR